MSVIGIDVGTGSVRAALVNVAERQIVLQETQPIQVWNPRKDHYEQSSEEIWNAVGTCIRALLVDTPPCPPVVAIGFSATCSLVFVSDNERLSVSQEDPQEGSPLRDIILWMDHRASEQTNRINQTEHPALQFVGGGVSVEMELPKILWIKENRPDTYQKATQFMDLADFLTYRATGSQSRSVCTVTCKWNYHDGQWDDDFLCLIGLGDLPEQQHQRIGSEILPVGACCGRITESFALETGLPLDTVVSAGMIDAHAGALAMMLAPAEFQDRTSQCSMDDLFRKRISILCGTSACHMSVAPTQRMVNGVWGPYDSALVPGYFLHEAGQSACGALLDHIVKSHPACPSCKESVYSLLNERLKQLSDSTEHVDCTLTKQVHVLPDFHGNRSPLADPQMTGLISGLTLDTSFDSLCILYYATLQALAYGTKHILEQIMEQHEDYQFETIVLNGGMAANELFVQELADITQCTVLVSRAQTMLMGSSITAGVAAGLFPSLQTAMVALSPPGNTVKPNPHKYHDIKYQIFLQMSQQQKKWRHMISDVIE